MKISKEIILPIELTSEEKDAVKKVRDMLSELNDIFETYDCGVIGNKEIGCNLDIDEIREIYKLLDVFNAWELVVYND